METEGIILEVTAAERAECTGLGLSLGHLAYRISPSGVLLRSTALGDARGGVMILLGVVPQAADPTALAAAIRTECAGRGYRGVYLACDPSAAPAAALAARLAETDLRLYVPEGVPYGIPVYDSGVTGGSFSLYMEETLSRHPGGIALELLPLAMEYILPAAGEGRALPREELDALLSAGYLQYYSAELAARYVTWRDEEGRTHFVLYDDVDSLREKVRLARAAGVRELFLLYGVLREELADFLEI